MSQRIGASLAERVRDITLRLYREAAAHALGRGIIIADTKFEFGLDRDGTLTLMDEILTPDSSRFWPLAGYREGANPPSYDKQFLRVWLEAVRDDGRAWNKKAPAPPLSDEVIEQTRQRYAEALRILSD
jgi:phosphoribosylaminoimidazole-succinocarboxamide synthase